MPSLLIGAIAFEGGAANVAGADGGVGKGGGASAVTGGSGVSLGLAVGCSIVMARVPMTGPPFRNCTRLIIASWLFARIK